MAGRQRSSSRRAAPRSWRALLLVAAIAAAPLAPVAANPLALAQGGDDPRGDPWSDYNAILWQPPNTAQCAALAAIGITAGAVIPRDRDHPAAFLDAQIAPLRACGERWYVENIATDFYAAYHRWSGDRPVNWRFIAVKEAYQRDPHDRAALIRDPSLSDPHWLATISTRLHETVSAHRQYHPLFYNLADEPGIADLSAFWDFDVSAPSLRGMRLWLSRQYGSLAALNREWGTQFSAWDRVMPIATAEAMQKRDGNYAAWGDFKAWMDVAFARAITAGAHAIHAADPTARAAFTGGQIPGWGGYDYSLLAKTVDVMELYDDGGNVEIARALNPHAILLTTSFGKGAQEAHEIWRELLRGSRGVILWDPAQEIATHDGGIGARGRDLAPVLREIRSGLGALLGHSERATAPIALLYSPASIRTEWLLDWQPKGDAWSARAPDAVYEDKSAVRQSMTSFLGLLQHSGLEPHITTPALIERGDLSRGGYRVLILPQTIALSADEADQIRRFVRAGGLVIADGEPGRFDQHSRRRPQPLLDSLFRAADGKDSAVSFAPNEATSAARDRLQQILARARITPDVALRTKESDDAPDDVEINRWRNGGVRIIALQRRPRAAAATSETSPAQDETVTLSLPRAAFLYDLRQRKALGYRDRVELALDPILPTILALSPQRRRAPHVLGPRRAGRGGRLRLDLATAGRETAALPVFHIAVIDPDGHALGPFGENLLLPRGHRIWTLALPADAPLGSWKIEVTDLLGGGITVWPVTVTSTND